MTHVTILLVEDDADMRYVLGERLWALFPEDRILIAQSAEAGLAFTHETPVDAIVLDLHLSDMDGFTFASAVEGDPRPRIIALTGDVRPNVRERAKQAGFAEFLEKPQGLDELGEALRRVLAGRRAA